MRLRRKSFLTSTNYQFCIAMRIVNIKKYEIFVIKSNRPAIKLVINENLNDFNTKFHFHFNSKIESKRSKSCILPLCKYLHESCILSWFLTFISFKLKWPKIFQFYFVNHFLWCSDDAAAQNNHKDPRFQ